MVVRGGHDGTNEPFADSYADSIAFCFAQRDAYAFTQRDAIAKPDAIGIANAITNPVIRAIVEPDTQPIAAQLVKDGKRRTTNSDPTLPMAGADFDDCLSHYLHP